MLALPEMGVSGAFQVLAVDPCPEIESGPGRIVTGVYRHGRGRVYNVWVAGESEPLGATAGHPFWSADRRAWVSVGELRAGERVVVTGGTVAVRRMVEAGDEPVYNLEVDIDHCYRVEEQGILVHNASASQDAATGEAALKAISCCPTETLVGVSRSTLFKSPAGLGVVYILRRSSDLNPVHGGNRSSQVSASYRKCMFSNRLSA